MEQESAVKPEQVKRGGDAGKSTGVMMIFAGIIFLMATSGIRFGGRSPWMLVALLPIYWIGARAYRQYREEGRLTRRVLGIALYGVLPFAYIAAMALGYSVSGLWPLGVIVVGVSFILSSSD